MMMAFVVVGEFVVLVEQVVVCTIRMLLVLCLENREKKEVRCCTGSLKIECASTVLRLFSDDSRYSPLCERVHANHSKPRAFQ